MRFTFIHAADLHIDSPLAALGRKNAEAATYFARASRLAVQALIEETIRTQAKFLIIAGDVFDREWRDMTTGHFFMGELAKLERAGIPVFMIRGNHDAASRVTRGLVWPPNVREFDTRKAESKYLEDLQVALHGRSFADGSVEAGFVSTYPLRRDGWLNIGVLHTSLDGKPGHDPYAPCSVPELSAFGYDYWALGHIHKAEIVSHDPWIVYPGNIQGRSVRETGAKGAMRVDVEDGRIVAVTPFVLDAARWTHEKIDISACESEEAIFDLMRTRLAQAQGDNDGRPLAARVTLTGESGLHDSLLAGFAQFNEQAQAEATRVADECWLEKLRLETRPLTLPATSDDDLELKSFDLRGLLRDAAHEPAFAQAVAELAQEIGAKLPPHLREQFAADGATEPEALGETAQHYISGSLNRSVGT